ncbi:MAG: DNA polymerase III subunit delta [Gemmatimonadota bacterium]|nr:DNA polymerase III subunit delta [Gemmatimonadota bacterium]
MPVVELSALEEDFTKREFARAYYFHGDDDFQKDVAVRQLIEAAVDPATRDFNLEVRRGGDLEGESLASLLGTPPMMAERRMVVIRDVPALRKEARAALDAYLRAPASDLVLLLVAPSEARQEAALVKRCASVDFVAPDGSRLQRWIVKHVDALGGKIAANAADLLTSAVGADLSMLATELEKLMSYTGGAPIDEDAVSAIVGVRRGETPGDLLDRIAARDVKGALGMLDVVLGQPKTNAVTLLMALSTQMFGIAYARALRDRGLAASRLSGELFGFLKAGGGAYTGRPWGEATAAWAKAVDHWSASELEAALDALLGADIALKESRVSSEEQVLTSLILNLCAGSSGRAAA